MGAQLGKAEGMKLAAGSPMPGKGLYPWVCHVIREGHSATTGCPRAPWRSRGQTCAWGLEGHTDSEDRGAEGKPSLL